MIAVIWSATCPASTFRPANGSSVSNRICPPARTCSTARAARRLQRQVTSPADLAAPALAGPCIASRFAAARSTTDGAAWAIEHRTTEHPPVWSPLPVARPSRPSRLRRLFLQSIGALRSHDAHVPQLHAAAGTRMLLTGLAGLSTILALDWLWLTFGKNHNGVGLFKEAVQVVATVGPAGPSHGDHFYDLFAALAMLLAMLFTAMFTAGVVERLLGTSLIGLVGPRILPRRNHVIVVGLGQVGLRLCLELRRLNIPVLTVERDDRARNLRLAKSLGIPTIVGHGTDKNVLERACIGRALCLAAVGSDDRDNIAVSVAAHGVRPGVRLVLRAGEQEALADTGSLLPLGITRNVTVLSATFAVARLVGLAADRVIAVHDHVHLEIEGAFERYSLAARYQCTHIHAGRAITPIS